LWKLPSGDIASATARNVELSGCELAGLLFWPADNYIGPCSPPMEADGSGTVQLPRGGAGGMGKAWSILSFPSVWLWSSSAEKDGYIPTLVPGPRWELGKASNQPLADGRQVNTISTMCIWIQVRASPHRFRVHRSRCGRSSQCGTLRPHEIHVKGKHHELPPLCFYRTELLGYAHQENTPNIGFSRIPPTR
jgi:hypothetical protein